jgi:hypothetical protein
MAGTPFTPKSFWLFIVAEAPTAEAPTREFPLGSLIAGVGTIDVEHDFVAHTVNGKAVRDF